MDRAARGRRECHAPDALRGAAGYTLAASTYFPFVSSTRPVTASRIRASVTSPPSCLPASASAIAALVRGVPSASSPRTSGVARSIMAFSSAVPVMVGVLVEAAQAAYVRAPPGAASAAYGGVGLALG